MRILILSFLLVSALHQTIAQTILVPYRVGDLFGLSDTNGILKVKPEFTSLSPYKMPQYAFTFKKVLQRNGQNNTTESELFSDQNLYGIIYKGKKILETNLCHEFDFLSGACIIGHGRRDYYHRKEEGGLRKGVKVETQDGHSEHANDRRGRTCQYLFNLKGENLFPDGMHRIEMFDFIGNQLQEVYRKILFKVTDFKNQVSLVQYDAVNGKIDRWVIKDKFQINRPTDNDRKGIIAVYESNHQVNPVYYKIFHGVNGFDLKPQQDKKPSVNVATEINEAIEYPTMVMEAPAYEEKVKVSTEAIQQQPVYLNISFNVSKGDSGYIFSQTTSDVLNNGKDTAFITNSFKDIDTAFISHYFNRFSSPNKDTFFSVNSIIFFESNHKKGWIAKELQSSALYDSLLILENYSVNHVTPVMLVMNNMNGRRKYGLMDAMNYTLLPVEYDSIVLQMNPYYQPRQKDMWHSVRLRTTMVTGYQNGHASIYANYDSLITAKNYDSITYMPDFTMNSTGAFILKKDRCYDIVMDVLEIGETIKYLPLCVPYRPRYLHTYFNRIKQLDLLALEDEKGRFFCYSTLSGLVLYKEK